MYDVYVLRALFVRVVRLLCHCVVMCVLSKTYIRVMSVFVLVCLVHAAFLCLFCLYTMYLCVLSKYGECLLFVYVCLVIWGIATFFCAACRLLLCM